MDVGDLPRQREGERDRPSPPDAALKPACPVQGSSKKASASRLEAERDLGSMARHCCVVPAHDCRAMTNLSWAIGQPRLRMGPPLNQDPKRNCHPTPIVRYWYSGHPIGTECHAQLLSKDRSEDSPTRRFP